jgi:nitrogenase molybdenum-iron protein NifN
MNSPAMALSASETGGPAAARNACKLCAPLGACVVFSGLEGCVPFLHGSQGCATYIRRYLISHFREPVDIASSSFTEEDTVFGGARNLKAGLRNVATQYRPEAIGVATTCLAETIGEDLPRILADYQKEASDSAPTSLIRVATPSYAGTHTDGFHATVAAVVQQHVQPGPDHDRVNLLPGFVSTEDLRHLKEMLKATGVAFTLLPDYSATLDGPTWSEYQRLQPGGTSLASVARMSGAPATFELGRTLAAKSETAASWLEKEFSVARVALGLPIGVRETDRFFSELEQVLGKPMPAIIGEERGRLIDALVDGHKYVVGQRAVLFGDQDFVIGLASLLNELGIRPVLCASGSKTGVFEKCLREMLTDVDTRELVVLEGVDHAAIGEHAQALKPDFLLGSSKGYSMAREMNVPLVRVGFPIHDRIGGQRLLHLGYRGAQQLFDRIVNTLLEARQDNSDVGYSYL